MRRMHFFYSQFWKNVISGPNEEKSEPIWYGIEFKDRNNDFQLIFTPTNDFKDLTYIAL